MTTLLCMYVSRRHHGRQRQPRQRHFPIQNVRAGEPSRQTPRYPAESPPKHLHLLRGLLYVLYIIVRQLEIPHLPYLAALRTKVSSYYYDASCHVDSDPCRLRTRLWGEQCSAPSSTQCWKPVPMPQDGNCGSDGIRMSS